MVMVKEKSNCLLQSCKNSSLLCHLACCIYCFCKFEEICTIDVKLKLDLLKVFLCNS